MKTLQTRLFMLQMTSMVWPFDREIPEQNSDWIYALLFYVWLELQK